LCFSPVSLPGTPRLSTLSLHDALPTSTTSSPPATPPPRRSRWRSRGCARPGGSPPARPRCWSASAAASPGPARWCACPEVRRSAGQLGDVLRHAVAAHGPRPGPRPVLAHGGVAVVGREHPQHVGARLPHDSREVALDVREVVGPPRLAGRVTDRRAQLLPVGDDEDRKSTRLNSSHVQISYA